MLGSDLQQAARGLDLLGSWQVSRKLMLLLPLGAARYCILHDGDDLEVGGLADSGSGTGRNSGKRSHMLVQLPQQEGRSCLWVPSWTRCHAVSDRLTSMRTNIDARHPPYPTSHVPILILVARLMSESGLC